MLRAEKGYPIVGQDTDGTVTPHDLGLGWAVSRTKPDFVGKRSFARADTARADRKQLVGLLPEDPGCCLPEGAHLVGTGYGRRHRCRRSGHVTSATTARRWAGRSPSALVRRRSRPDRYGAARGDPVGAGAGTGGGRRAGGPGGGAS